MKNWYSICALNKGTEISIYDEIGAYGDVAIERWQKLTGQATMLDGDGRSFDEIAAERVAA